MTKMENTMMRNSYKRRPILMNDEKPKGMLVNILRSGQVCV